MITAIWAYHITSFERRWNEGTRFCCVCMTRLFMKAERERDRKIKKKIRSANHVTIWRANFFLLISNNGLCAIKPNSNYTIANRYQRHNIGYLLGRWADLHFVTATRCQLMGEEYWPTALHFRGFDDVVHQMLLHQIHHTDDRTLPIATPSAPGPSLSSSRDVYMGVSVVYLISKCAVDCQRRRGLGDKKNQMSHRLRTNYISSQIETASRLYSRSCNYSITNEALHKEACECHLAQKCFSL